MQKALSANVPISMIYLTHLNLKRYNRSHFYQPCCLPLSSFQFSVFLKWGTHNECNKNLCLRYSKSELKPTQPGKYSWKQGCILMVWNVAIGCEMINVLGFEDTAFIPHQHSKLGRDCLGFLLTCRSQLHSIHHCPNLQKYFRSSRKMEWDYLQGHDRTIGKGFKVKESKSVNRWDPTQTLWTRTLVYQTKNKEKVFFFHQKKINKVYNDWFPYKTDQASMDSINFDTQSLTSLPGKKIISQTVFFFPPLKDSKFY